LIVEYGYRLPLDDADSPPTLNPSPGLDIYLIDIGSAGSYGACGTDDPDRSTDAQVSAYCILDNDYSPAQFPTVNGTEALQVTTAHEFFHAVQFAYDHRELTRAPWLAEGTATWFEDEVFDDVNANYEFLWDSPLHQPEIPLDAFGKETGAWSDPLGEEHFEYGAWLMWRFATEYFGFLADPAGPPDNAIIRKVWERAENESAKGAVKAAFKARGETFDDFFVIFGGANVLPPLFYREGVDYLAELDNTFGPWDSTFVLDATKNLGLRRLSLDHLSNSSVRFYVPDNLAADTTLEISLDLPDDATGSGAEILSSLPSCATYYPIRLNESGKGTVTVPIGPTDCQGVQGVSERPFIVSLVLTNASFTLDNRTFSYRAVVKQ
jgi:hypothetical protein